MNSRKTPARRTRLLAAFWLIYRLISSKSTAWCVGQQRFVEAPCLSFSLYEQWRAWRAPVRDNGVIWRQQRPAFYSPSLHWFRGSFHLTSASAGCSFSSVRAAGSSARIMRVSRQHIESFSPLSHITDVVLLCFLPSLWTNYPSLNSSSLC